MDIVSAHKSSLRGDMANRALCRSASIGELMDALIGFLRHLQRFGGLTEVWAGLNEKVDMRLMKSWGKTGEMCCNWVRGKKGAPRAFQGLSKTPGQSLYV